MKTVNTVNKSIKTVETTEKQQSFHEKLLKVGSDKCVTLEFPKQESLKVW